MSTPFRLACFPPYLSKWLSGPAIAVDSPLYSSKTATDRSHHSSQSSYNSTRNKEKREIEIDINERERKRKKRERDKREKSKK